jgi:hypothetical protein
MIFQRFKDEAALYNTSSPSLISTDPQTRSREVLVAPEPQDSQTLAAINRPVAHAPGPAVDFVAASQGQPETGVDDRPDQESGSIQPKEQMEAVEGAENEEVLPETALMESSGEEDLSFTAAPRDKLFETLLGAMEQSPVVAQETLYGALSDEDEGVRQKALEIALYEGIPLEPERIEKMLSEDPSEYVRLEAFQALTVLYARDGYDLYPLIGWGMEEADSMVGSLAQDLYEAMNAPLEASETENETLKK